MRICITRSEKYAYSETFIRDQITEFSKLAKVYTIHSGRYPEKSEDDILLSPKVFWLIHKVIKTFIGRNNFFSNYGIKKFLKDNKIDVVIANYGTSASHMVPVCKNLNIPLLPIFHGHDATDKKYLTKYATKYQKLFDYASSIIVVSNDMKKKLIEVGANYKNVEVVSCGVNPEKFKPQTNKLFNKNFLAVGRFTPKKGPLYTIQAFHKVLKNFPDATLTMVGKKNGLFGACQDLVNELKISKSVIFTGILDQKEISNLMNTSLAFVQHSVTAPNGDMEGTPVSIMEAASSGLPIVSTLHGGIKDAVINNQTGFLVKETDIDAMSKHMITLCENNILAREFGTNARKHIIENYHQKNQIAKLYKLANNAINKK